MTAEEVLHCPKNILEVFSQNAHKFPLNFHLLDINKIDDQVMGRTAPSKHYQTNNFECHSIAKPISRCISPIAKVGND